jgi:hypothetical protein
MALTPEEIREITIELKLQAQLQQEISGNYDSYIKGLKKVKALDEEINRLTKAHNEITAKAAATGRALTDVEKEKLRILEDQTKQLQLQHKIYSNVLKDVNKTKILLAKSGAEIVKGLIKIPNLVENAYGKFKGLGLFELEKAVKKSALSMGLVGESSRAFSADIRNAAYQTTMIGVGMEQLAKMQSDYSEALGRNVMLNENGLKAMAELAAATALGAEGAAKMAADMEQQGYSAERTRDFVEQTMNDTTKMGLNASKVIKNIQQNMKMLNKYNFKGGVKGLAKMAETTSKLGVDMNFATGMADKLFDIEGAVEMSSQLQVLGGAWAGLADPFHLMYMARNDMAGLTEEIGQAAASQATFNAELGEFEISSLEMHRLRKVAEQTGIAYEDLATAGKNAAKFTKIKSQVGFAMDKDSKEFLTNTAKLDKDGKASIEVMIDGKKTKKFLNQLSKAEVEKLMGEDKRLKERAEEAQTFDESFTNLINSFKVSLLPLIDTMNDKLVPELTKLAADFNAKGGWGETVREFAKTIGGWISSVAGFMIEWPELTAGLLLFAKAAPIIGALGSFIGDKVKWFANGVALAAGFNSAASVGGSGGSITDMISGGGKKGKGSFFKNYKGLRSMGDSRLGAAKSAFKWSGGGMKMLGGAGGGLLAGGIDSIDAFSEGKTGEGFGNIAGGVLGGALGSLLGPVGTVIGSSLGSMAGGYIGGLFDEDESSRDRRGSIASMGDGIVFDAKDKFLKMNDGTMIAGTQKGGNKALADELAGNSSKTMKIEFGEMHIKFDELRVTSPGSPGVAIDIMKNPIIMRELTQNIQNQIQMALKGGKA